MNLFHHISDTPLSVFIACVCDRQTDRLVKHGKAKPVDIARAWEMLYAEYNDTAGIPAGKILISLARDVAYHDAKLKAVAMCLKVLQFHPDKLCIKVLHDYGYNYAFDITRPEQYAKDLDAVATRTGAIRMTLEIKEAEMKRESAKVSGKAMTSADFDKILATLSAHFHIPIHEFKKGTVSEYLSYRKMYELEGIAIRRQQERVKHG